MILNRFPGPFHRGNATRPGDRQKTVPGRSPFRSGGRLTDILKGGVLLAKEHVDLNTKVVEMRNIVKKFGDFTANDGVNLTVHEGEFLAVVGQSGSGKSTLLHLLGTLDVPDSGSIYFDGQRIDNLPMGQRDSLRNHFIGMIFQFYHLLPEMTTLENVLTPLMIRDGVLKYLRRRSMYVREAKELLDLVGLSHRLRHRPNELSGGEMQRASIARALIAGPRLLLADEPTGNLDSKASADVLDLLRRLNEEKKLTVVMVTHDMSQARDADRAIRIVDGQVVHEEQLK